MSEPGTFQCPKGHIVVTSHGLVTVETMGSWGNSRVAFERAGIRNMVWRIELGTLVDKTRNEAVVAMLRDPHAGFLLFIDGDMQWEPQALIMLVETAYSSLPHADIVGGWCPLRGFPHLPTIDPGSGTWEPVEPGIGPIEVMRTGAAFVLIKRHVFEKMTPPWYGVRFVPRPLDVLQEFETFVLQKYDGQNPFRTMPEWARIEQCAADDSAASPRDVAYEWHHVGEDSNFTDRARALGFRVVVQTNAVINHIERRLITPAEHLKAMKELRQSEARASGVLEYP